MGREWRGWARMIAFRGYFFPLYFRHHSGYIVQQWVDVIAPWRLGYFFFFFFCSSPSLHLTHKIAHFGSSRWARCDLPLLSFWFQKKRKKKNAVFYFLFCFSTCRLEPSVQMLDCFPRGAHEPHGWCDVISSFWFFGGYVKDFLDRTQSKESNKKPRRRRRRRRRNSLWGETTLLLCLC